MFALNWFKYKTLFEIENRIKSNISKIEILNLIWFGFNWFQSNRIKLEFFNQYCFELVLIGHIFKSNWI